MTKQNYLIEVHDSKGLLSSQGVLLNDEGLRVLQQGIRAAQDVDDPNVSDDENDTSPYEDYIKRENDKLDEVYVSGDDVELDPETAAKYQADRRKDDEYR